MKLDTTYLFIVGIFTLLILLFATGMQPENNQVKGEYELYWQLEEQFIDAQYETRTYQIEDTVQSRQEQLEAVIKSIQETTDELVREIKPVAPEGRLDEEDIAISANRVTLRLAGVKKWYILDTDSMVPTMDVGTTVLTVEPEKPTHIKKGDIIVFTREQQDIVHRIIDIREEQGELIFQTKGDNVRYPDTQLVEFHQIQGVVIGIIY